VRRVSLLRLIAVFTWTGLSSLGGGRSAYFHDALVRRRGFIRHDEFVQDFTLSQVLPGPNFSNLAVALGYRLAGIAGGVWGLLAIVLPGAVILVGVARLYLHGAFGGSATLLLRSLSAAVVGLDRYGESAPGGVLFKHFGFTTEHAFHRFLKRTMALEGLFGSADAIVLDVGRKLLAERRVPTLIEL